MPKRMHSNHPRFDDDQGNIECSHIHDDHDSCNGNHMSIEMDLRRILRDHVLFLDNTQLMRTQLMVEESKRIQDDTDILCQGNNIINRLD